MTFIPFPYQETTIQKMEEFGGRAILALDPGLGKTGCSLEALVRNPHWLPALVICPASIKYQWQMEASSKFGMQSSVCEGEKPPRQGFAPNTPLTIINYDILQYWKDHLKAQNYKTIILDETQTLGNPRTIRTRTVRDLSHKIKNRFALSGTPLTQRTKELFPLLQIMWPEHYKSFFSYAQDYCSPRLRFGRWDYSQSRNTDLLHKELIQRGMIRYRKADVLQDLPEKVRLILPCKLSQPEVYREAQNDFMVYLMKHKAHKLRTASKAEKLFQMGELLRLTTRLKLRAVIDWCNGFLESSDEKLVLMAIHHKAIDIFRQERYIKTRSVVINGDVSKKGRKQAVDQFQHDSKTRLFIGNIQSAGIGLDGLQKAASTMAIVELPWRPADLYQIESRLERIGQNEKTFVYYLIANDTIEEKVCRILQEKQKIVSSVLDGGDCADDFNIYDAVLQEFEKGFH